MAFAAKVQLTVDTSNKSQLASEIQSAINGATAASPITLRKFSASLSKSAAKSIAASISRDLASNPVQIRKIQISDAAISSLRKQLGKALDSDSSTTVMKKVASGVQTLRTTISALGTQYKSLFGKVDASSIDPVKSKLNELIQIERTASVEFRELTDDEAERANSLASEINNEVIAIKEKARAQAEAASQAKRAAEAEAKASQKASELVTNYRSINSLLDRIARLRTDYPKMFGADGDAKRELDDLENQLIDVNKNYVEISKQDFQNVNNGVAKLEGRTKSLTKNSDKLGNTLSNLIGKFGSWYIISQTITQVIRLFRKMYQNVVEVDTAMTELKKVTEGTASVYENFLSRASEKAKNLGASLVDTVEATAEFARLGYTIEESSSFAEAALLYKNVGDGIDSITEATDSLISTIKAFGIEASDAISIVDEFNEVGNNFAISSEGIGTALQTSSSALAAANNSMEQSIALAVGMNSVLQDPARVGTALKTTSMYLRSASSELEEAGMETDGLVESTSKLRDIILGMTGIDIMVDEDTFKSTYDFYKELSVIWDTLKDVEQASLLEMLGGKKNATAISSLITNFSDAEAAFETASDSAGSAVAENEKYLDSINGKLSVLSAAWQSYSTEMMDSDFIKGGIGALSSFLGLLDSAPGKIASITLAVSALGVAAISLKSQFTKGAEFSDIFSSSGIISGKGLGIAAAAAAGISIVVAAIKAYDESLWSIKESVTEATSEIGNLQDYSKSLKEVDVASMDAAAQTEFLSNAQKELFEQFGLIVDISDDVVSSIDKINDSLAKSTEASANTAWAGVQDQFSRFDDTMNKRSSTATLARGYSDSYSFLTGEDLKLAEAAIEASGMMVGEWRKVWDSSGEYFSTSLDFGTTKIEEQLSMLSKAKNQLEAWGLTENELYNNISTIYSSMIGQIDKASESYTQAFEAWKNYILYSEIGGSNGILLEENQGQAFVQMIQGWEETGKSAAAIGDMISYVVSLYPELVDEAISYCETQGVTSSTIYGHLVEEMDAWEGAANAVDSYSNAVDNAGSSAESNAKKLSILGSELDRTATEAASLVKGLESLKGGTFLDFAVNDDGEVTEDLEAIISEFPELKDCIADYSDGLVTAEELTDAFQESLDEYDFSSLVDGIADVINAGELLSSATEEVNESGKLSISTLQNIASKYPQLSQNVLGYISGLESEEQILNELKTAYINDALAQAESELIKRINSGESVEDISGMYSSLFNTLGLYYQGNTSNYSSMLNAIAQADALCSATLKGNWKSYYGSLSDALNASISIAQSAYNTAVAQYKNTYNTADLVAASAASRSLATLKKAKAAYDAAKTAISNAASYSFSGVSASYSPTSTSSGGSSSSSDEVDEVQKAKDELQSWLDLQERAAARLEKLSEDTTQERLDIYKRTYDSLLSTMKNYLVNGGEMTDDFYMWVEEQAWDVADSIEDIFGEVNGSLSDILDMTQDMIKQEAKSQIDALEDQIDAYSKIVQLKKDSLSSTRDENEYQESVAEKAEKIAALQARISQLSLDDSRDAQVERASLGEELSELQKELSDFQSDHTYDSIVSSLSASETAYEDSKQKEIDELQEVVDSETELYSEAINMITNEWSSLYQKLLDYNEKYGLDIGEDIETAWDTASSAVKRYGSYVEALASIESNVASKSIFNSSNPSSSASTEPSASTPSTPAASASASNNSSTSPSSSSTSTPAETYPYGKASAVSGYIQQGSSGTAVKAIQYALNKLGYGNSGTSSLDGSFGSGTAKAVRSFQSAMGLSADGVVGPATKAKFAAKGYRRGGLVDYTGAAVVHGSLSEPEAFLDAEDTQNLSELTESLKDANRAYRLFSVDSYISERYGAQASINANEVAGRRITPSALEKDYLESAKNVINSGNIGDVSIEVPVQIVVTEKLDKRDIQQQADEIGRIASKYIESGFTRKGIRPSIKSV